MGTWSASVFGNDSALDWLQRLEESENESAILDAIRQASSTGDDVDPDAAEACLAAAAVVAASAFEPVRGLPASAKTWIARRGYVPSRETVVQALAAVRQIGEASSLRELWEEGDWSPSWLKNVGTIAARLELALDSELPVRQPIKQRMPRLLYKMVEMARREPTAELRRKIREKLDALDDVDQPTPETGRQPPLCMLAEAGLVEEAISLLDRGADPNIVSSFSGGKPLWRACAAGHAEMGKVLLARGADLFDEILIDERTGHPIRPWSSDEERTRARPFRHSQALWHAVGSGTPATIALVLDAGADRNQTDINGETLLHKVCAAGRAENLRFLLTLGLDVNAVKPSDWTALHYAVAGGHLECVKVLLENGADPNVLEAQSHGHVTVLDTVEDPASELFRVIRQYGGKLAAEMPD